MNSVWFVENAASKWWTGGARVFATDEAHWTTDPQEAKQHASKGEAQSTCDYLGLNEIRPTEHIFLSKSAQGATPRTDISDLPAMLRDKDQIVIGGVLYCAPVMKHAADRIDQLERELADMMDQRDNFEALYAGSGFAVPSATTRFQEVLDAAIMVKRHIGYDLREGCVRVHIGDQRAAAESVSLLWTALGRYYTDAPTPSDRTAGT